MGNTESDFWVYVLKNAQGQFYVGHTEDLPKRVAEHNGSRCGAMSWTQKHGLWELVWSERHATRGSAVARERQIKRMRSARWIRENLLGQKPAGC